MQECNYRFVDVLMRDTVICRIWYDMQHRKIKFENYSQDYLFLPFGKKKQVTYVDFERFLEDRCFPRERVYKEELLHALGLDYYNPYDIVCKTHGVLYDDYIWLRFDGERLCFDDVKVRD